MSKRNKRKGKKAPLSKLSAKPKSQINPTRKKILYAILATSLTFFVEKFWSLILAPKEPPTPITRLDKIQSLLEREESRELWNKLERYSISLNAHVKNFEKTNNQDEALSIARILNTIFVGEGVHESLLEQLKITELLQYYDSATDYQPPPPGAVSLFPFIGLAYVQANLSNKGQEMYYIPRINEGYINRITSYDIWSKKIILKDEKIGSLNRLDLIMAVAFFAGGLPSTNLHSEAFKRLSSFHFAGLTVGNAKGETFTNTTNRVDLVSLRAIAEEFLTAYANFKFEVKRQKTTSQATTHPNRE